MWSPSKNQNWTFKVCDFSSQPQTCLSPFKVMTINQPQLTVSIFYIVNPNSYQQIAFLLQGRKEGRMETRKKGRKRGRGGRMKKENYKTFFSHNMFLIS